MKKILLVITLLLSARLAQQSFAQTNTFPATGNVGIGTTSPTTLFNVNSGAIRLKNPGLYPWGINIDVDFTSSWVREYSISRNATGKYLSMGVSGKSDGSFNYAYIGGNTTNDYPNAPWMVFSPNGMIGINNPVVSNTVSPGAWLDVRSLDTVNYVTIRSQIINKSNTLMYLASYPGNTTYTGWKGENVFESYSPLHISAANANGAIYFETGRINTTTLPRMMIDPTGNVAIGTTTNSKGYKLAVEGTIGARKVKVTQESWADFVFNKDYRLPSLQSVENYIAANGHLEGVPSTKEVEKEGVDVAGMNKVLLQKVEELTLYMIALKKENAAQQMAVKELKKANATQQARIEKLEKALRK